MTGSLPRLILPRHLQRCNWGSQLMVFPGQHRLSQTITNDREEVLLSSCSRQCIQVLVQPFSHAMQSGDHTLCFRNAVEMERQRACHQSVLVFAWKHWVNRYALLKDMSCHRNQSYDAVKLVSSSWGLLGFETPKLWSLTCHV